MTFPLDNPALFGVGGCSGHQQVFGHRLGSGNGAPAWLPEGAVAGVDYTEGEAWLFDTLITDLSTIHGAAGDPPVGFDPAAVTAAGMAVTEANSNRPHATNQLEDVFLAMDFCVVFDWDQLDYPTGLYGTFLDLTENEGAANQVRASLEGDFGSAGNAVWTDANNGEFAVLGVAVENGHNKIAASANAAGWLSSLNGATAVLDSPVTPGLVDGPIAAIGCVRQSGVDVLNGTIRRVIFYPNEQSAAEVEALSAL